MVTPRSRLAAVALTAVSLLLPAAATSAAPDERPAPVPADRLSAPLRAKNLPAAGKVLFYVGQDSDTLADLDAEVLEVDRRFPRPSGVTLYTNLVGSPMSGMFQPTDYGAGENDFPATLEEYRGGLAVGLYLSDPTQTPSAALAGEADAATVATYRGWLDEMLRYLDSTDREVFLRIGYEFDGPWNAYDPELYKAAYRYVAERIDELGADKVATVWQTASWPRSDVPDEAYDATSPGHWEQWYPGDEYVDWAGMSHFYGERYADYQWSCDVASATRTPLEVQESFLDFAREHRKPVFVSESAPQGFDNGALTADCIFADDVPPVDVTAEEIWDAWYRPYFDFVADNRDVVRGVSYINTNWQSQSMWRCVPGSCPQGYWGDSRIQADPLILERFTAELRDPMWARARGVAPRFEVPDYSSAGRSEAEYADLPQGGTTGIAVADGSASNGRSALVYANGASMEFDRVAAGDAVTIRYATTTDGVRLTVLVDGREVSALPLPNQGSATAWTTVVVPTSVPTDATVTLRLDSGDVVWVDYIEPGQVGGGQGRTSG